MGSFNKITICGYLGRDPEMRHIPSGQAVCNFSIATTEKRKNARGEQEDSTTWFRVTTWGRQAELCNEHLRKGSQVYVDGKLRQEEYTDREGNKRTNLEVNASDIQFLGPRNADSSEESSRRTTKQEVGRATEESEKDEIPF